MRVAGEASGAPARRWICRSAARRPFASRPAWRPGERVWRGTIGGAPVVAQVRAAKVTRSRIERRGVSVLARLLTPRVAALAALMPEKGEAGTLEGAALPDAGPGRFDRGAEGQKVEAGETLAIVEAMKMENVLRAERAGTVARILAKPGDSLAVDAVIMEFA